MEGSTTSASHAHCYCQRATSGQDICCRCGSYRPPLQTTPPSLLTRISFWRFMNADWLESVPILDELLSDCEKELTLGRSSPPRTTAMTEEQKKDDRARGGTTGAQ